MTEPRVSLICCSLDGSIVSRFLERHAPFPPELEIIVVLQAVTQPRQLSVPGGTCLREIRIDRRGLSRARNTALRVATAPWCLFPDDDCWFEPGGLTRLVEASRCIGGEIDVARLRWAEARGDGRLVAEADPWYLARTVSSIELVVRRERLLAIGGFDERLGLGSEFGSGEDVDSALRLLGSTSRLPIVEGVVVHHAVGRQTPRLRARERFAAGVGRGRGYGAVQAKHGIPPSVVWLSALRSLLHARARTSRGLAFAVGVAVGRVAGAHAWQRRADGVSGPA